MHSMEREIEQSESEKIVDPDSWVKEVCKGVGQVYKTHGVLICRAKDVELRIRGDSLEIETDDSEISSPLYRIERCYVYSGKTKTFGMCKYRRTGGIFVQADPMTKELLVLASRGPLESIISNQGEVENAEQDLKFKV